MGCQSPQQMPTIPSYSRLSIEIIMSKKLLFVLALTLGGCVTTPPVNVPVVTTEKQTTNIDPELKKLCEDPSSVPDGPLTEGQTLQYMADEADKSIICSKREKSLLQLMCTALNIDCSDIPGIVNSAPPSVSTTQNTESTKP